ncbi:MAG: zinc-ribbon domain-containing protein [Clostridia bacterium]|nr:zinc-ribbon domain-containing protein [Clostridia bacterium]
MFCNKCGSPLADGSAFCSKCGARIGSSDSPMFPPTASIDYKPENKAANFFKNASLLLSGLITCLLTWPMVAWFETDLRLAGAVYSLIKKYNDYGEKRVWDNAVTASELLSVFCFIGVALVVLGIVFFILRAKGVIPKSKIIPICCFAIPTAIIILIAIFTHPAIFRYESTFSYIIY